MNSWDSISFILAALFSLAVEPGGGSGFSEWIIFCPVIERTDTKAFVSVRVESLVYTVGVLRPRHFAGAGRDVLPREAP